MRVYVGGVNKSSTRDGGEREGERESESERGVRVAVAWVVALVQSPILDSFSHRKREHSWSPHE